MLAALRKQATGWVVRILLILLIIAFAVWGIGDVFRAGGVTNVVAEVNGLPITVEDVRLEANAQYDNLQQQFGGRLDRTPELMEGLYRQALQGSITRRLLDAHAYELGLDVSNEALIRTIREDPLFQTAGQFDRSRFEIFLSSLGLSEAGYFDRLKSEILRNRMVAAVSGPATGSTAMARLLASWRGEQRRGTVLVVQADAMEAEPPDEATLQAYLEEHADQYQAPEYRKVEVVLLGAQDLVGEVAVSEEELRQTYETHKANYVEPERRTIVQLLASDRGVIEEAQAMVQAGKSFAEVADAMQDKGITTTTLGPVRAGELPGALGEAAFALAEGDVSEPIETAFGWHLLRLSEVQPRTEQPFEAVRDSLEAQLRHEKAINRLPDVVTSLDDALAGGAPLAEAAETAGARYYEIEGMDRQGRNREGEPVEEPRLTQEMLVEIFDAAEGEVSLVEETDDGRYYVYKVDAIEPARPHTLEEVREEVEAAWRQTKQQEAAVALAGELLEAAKGDKALDELAQERPAAAIEEVGPLTRTDEPQSEGLGPSVVEALFATAPGNITDHVVEVPKGAALVRTEEVIAADPESEQLSGVVREIARSRQAELLAQYEQALRARYEIEINQATLNALLTQ